MTQDQYEKLKKYIDACAEYHAVIESGKSNLFAYDMRAVAEMELDEAMGFKPKVP